MIANAAFLSAVTVFLLVGWIAGEVRLLAPYKVILFREHAALIGGAILILFLDLTATYYSVARWFFLRTPAASCFTSTASFRPTMPCWMTCGRT